MSELHPDAATNGDSNHSVSTFKAPTFPPHDPALWFTILEISLGTSCIMSSLKKMSHAFALLPHDVLCSVSYVIAAASNSDTPYEDLKKAVITRLRCSLTAHLQELLSKDILGTEKPTGLLRHQHNTPTQSTTSFSPTSSTSACHPPYNATCSL